MTFQPLAHRIGLLSMSDLSPNNKRKPNRLPFIVSANHSVSHALRFAESEGFLRNPNKLPLAPCSKKKERFACLSKLRQTNRPFSLRRVRDSNPRYDVMRTPHFECGTFDHSVNSPTLICEKRVQRYCFFLTYANNSAFFLKKAFVIREKVVPLQRIW